MTSNSGRRQPNSTLSTYHLNIVNIIKQDVVPWLHKAEVVRMQQRALFRQSRYKYHHRLQAGNADAITVWMRRSYISEENG